MSLEEKYKIFIIIVTFNGIEWLPKSLGSVKSYPTVVVDNNSTDGSVEYIESNFPSVKIFKNTENLGFGQANNLGIKYALDQEATHVFLLNQDAYLNEEVLPALLDYQSLNKEYGILSPMHLNGDGSRLDSKFSLYMGYDGNKDFYSDYVLHKDKKEVYNVPFVNAAGWLLSVDCIKKVGGFDPIFFHYGEDENYCQRVLYHGFNIGVMPKVYLNHDREERPEEKLSKATNRFQLQERELKIKFANLNESYNDELEKLMNKRKRFARLSFIKFKFGDARFFKSEYQYLQKLVHEIKQSRRICQNEKMPYL